MRFLGGLVAALCLLILAAAAGLGYVAWQFLGSAPETPGKTIMVEIEPGIGTVKIAEQLKQQNIITNERFFLAYIRILRSLGDPKKTTIKAGEYALSTSWPPQKVLAELVSGHVYLHKLVIPEGYAWWQTAETTQQAGLGAPDAFAKRMRDPDLLTKYNIPAPSLEGFLFPETYMFPRPKNNDPTPIIEAMLSAFWKEAAPKVWPHGLPDSENIRRTVILASMIEKETAVDAERPRIAGVYLNRLRANMPMQCDPTVIYGLGPSFDGNLHKSDLQDKFNPYNTYEHPGLPPGPICSPGLASLLAATNPEKNDFYYFVAKGDGTHQFSHDLAAHNSAVNKFQRKKR